MSSAGKQTLSRRVILFLSSACRCDFRGGVVKYIRFGIVGTNYYCNSKFKDIFSVDLKRILTSSERVDKIKRS